jgi:hypothetical protein
MATHEELAQNTAPAPQLGTSDVFIGIAGLTDVEALQAEAGARLAGLGSALGVENANITIAYPGFDNTQAAVEDPGGALRFVSYPLPANEASATPWALAAGSQRALLGLAAETQAKVCVLLNPDLQLLSGGSLESLALPVLEKKAELVLPIYTSGRYDSLLNDSILAPLTRALYGKRVSYPLASDYAVSARMVARLLQSAHTAAHVNAGSILWPATVAATIDAPVAEAATGVRHAARTEGLELSAVIAQLVGSVFADMEHNAPLWQRVRGSHATLLSGTVQSSADELQVTNPDPRSMIDSFLLGWRSLQEVWGLVLPPVTLLELKRLTLVAPERFRMPDELWVRIIYDFGMAFRLRTISRTHLLGALTPLYLGWVASYVNGWSHPASGLVSLTPAQRHEQLAKAFEDGKPYLVRRWRWPDRFNP